MSPLREPVVRRLLELDAEGGLTTAHVRLAAQSLAVSERTVFRWLERARATGKTAAARKSRFEVGEELRARLAFWRGNVSAVHRELVEAAERGGPGAPSLRQLQRAGAGDRRQTLLSLRWTTSSSSSPSRTGGTCWSAPSTTTSSRSGGGWAP